MSIQAVAWAISQKVGSPTGKVLLVCLANYANENGECWPSQKTISREAELGERATRNWLKKLETDGFIERRRRNRSDGSRTSDFIILNLTKQPETTEKDLPAKSAARPSQAASHSKSTGTSCRLGRHDVPGIEPSPYPSIEPPSTGAQAREDGFDQLWNEWPSAERPSKRKAAEHSFRRLSGDERRQAVKFAPAFRRLCQKREEPALMIPYLKNLFFQEIAEGPEVTPEGYFYFTPDRPEWEAWLDRLESRFGVDSRARILKAGFFKDPHRWPPKIDAEQLGRHHDGC